MMRKWYAVTSSEYPEWDRGTYDAKTAVEMMIAAQDDTEHNIKISVVEDDFCTDEFYESEFLYIVEVDGENWLCFECYDDALDAAYSCGVIANVKIITDLGDETVVWDIDTADAERYVLEEYTYLTRKEATKAVNEGVCFYPDNDEGYSYFKESYNCDEEICESWEALDKVDTQYCPLRIERFL